MEAYCVKCRAKGEMTNGHEEEMKNGMMAMKGECSKCHTGMYRIMGKAEKNA